MSADRNVEVRVLGLPVPLWSEAREHLDDLVREFTLITAGCSVSASNAAPHELLELMDELAQNFNPAGSSQDVALQRAALEGRTEIDLIYVVPPEFADASARLGAALDAADAYCRNGTHLLALATEPAPLAFRRWFLGQFVDQIGGAEPVGWPQWRATHHQLD